MKTAKWMWLGMIIAAVVCTFQVPSVQGQGVCTGIIQVKNKDSNADYGYLLPQRSRFGEYGTFTSDSTEAMQVSFHRSERFSMTIVNGSDRNFPFAGAAIGYASDSDDLAIGSYNYAYIVGTKETPIDSPPVDDGGNSFEASTGISASYESAIWSLSNNNELIPQWVNTDSSTPLTHIVYANDGNEALILTGDVETLNSTFGVSYPAVTLSFITQTDCSSTSTETPTSTATSTPSTTTTTTPSNTPTVTGTATPSNTRTSTPSTTPTASSIPSKTATTTNTPTSTPVPPSSTATNTPTNTPGAPITVNTDADTYVQQKDSKKNFGTKDKMIVDGNDDPREVYVRFNVSGLTSAPRKVVLRLYVSSGSKDGPRLYQAANATWNETTLTWNTRPGATGAVLGNLGKVSSKVWVEFDVSSVVTTNGAYSFVLVGDSTESIEFSSRESANKPQLVITR